MDMKILVKSIKMADAETCEKFIFYYARKNLRILFMAWTGGKHLLKCKICVRQISLFSRFHVKTAGQVIPVSKRKLKWI